MLLLNRVLALIIVFTVIFSCASAQAQMGLGGSNLFGNSGMIDSGSGNNGNPYSALNQMAAPRVPIGKATSTENADVDWQPAYLQPFPNSLFEYTGITFNDKRNSVGNIFCGYKRAGY